MGKTALVIIGVLLLAVLLLAGSYNRLVGKRNFVDNQWAQVENQMQRRADLIPNIVNTVKGYAKLEENIFTRIADARARIQSTTTTPEQKIEADNQLSQVTREAGLLPAAGGGGILGNGGRFLSITEQYPQLKSDQQFMRLQDELAGTENRMAVARKDYNDAATDYNTSRQRFPTVLIAGLMGFPDKPLFKADEGARTAPKVQF